MKIKSLLIINMVGVTLLPVSSINNRIILNSNQSSNSLQSFINQKSSCGGALQQSFGNNGTNFPGTSFVNGSICGSTDGLFDQITAIALQSDGKIVAAGYTVSDGGSYYYFAVARFTPDGQLDPTFVGGNGTTSLIPGTVFINGSISDAADPYDQINAITIQPDGKIVTAGYTYKRAIHYYSYFAVARFNTDGSLDSSFVGGNGTGTTSYIPGTIFINGIISGSYYTNDIINAIALQDDGKIVAGGVSSYGSSNYPYYFALARFNTDGSLDLTFTGGNRAASSIPGTIYVNGSISASNYPYDQINALGLQADGKIVAAGFSGVGYGPQYPTYWAIARFTTDGSLDASFVGGNGTQTALTGTFFITSIAGQIRENTSDNCTALQILPDNNILLGGFTTTTNTNIAYFGVARLFGETGALDTSFNGGNGAVTALPGTVYIPKSICTGSDQAYDQLTALALQNDGTIAAAGYTQPFGFIPHFFAVAHFLEDGALDTQFTGGGSLVNIVPGTVYIPESIGGSPIVNDQSFAVAVSSSGSIIAGGFTTSEIGQFFSLAEFFNPQNFSSYKKSYTTAGAGINC